jgi:hypothetical protein
MEEKSHLVINGAEDNYPDWATLFTKAVDDVARILRSEADLFRISFEGSLKAQMDQALVALSAAGALICAGVCALASLIAFLHESHPDLNWSGLPWWQALGAGAILMFLVGICIRAVAGHGPPIHIENVISADADRPWD